MAALPAQAQWTGMLGDHRDAHRAPLKNSMRRVQLALRQEA
jgi:hypothetical protein